MGACQWRLPAGCCLKSAPNVSLFIWENCAFFFAICTLSSCCGNKRLSGATSWSYAAKAGFAWSLLLFRVHRKQKSDTKTINHAPSLRCCPLFFTSQCVCHSEIVYIFSYSNYSWSGERWRGWAKKERIAVYVTVDRGALSVAWGAHWAQICLHSQAHTVVTLSWSVYLFTVRYCTFTWTSSQGQKVSKNLLNWFWGDAEHREKKKLFSFFVM